MSNVGYYRRLRGLTQTELGDKIGVKQPHISRIEAGDEGPPLAVFRQIAEALEISLATLFADHLTEIEVKLADLYRQSGPEGRRLLEKLVREAEALPPESDQAATPSEGV